MLAIDECINRILTCTSDVGCPRENACFIVATWAREARAQQGTEGAIDLAEPDLDEISNYVPGWEMP